MAAQRDILIEMRKWAETPSTPEYMRADMKRAADEIERLRAAHQDIVRKYEKIMGEPPDWTNFTDGDERLKWAREAWYGAASISRKVLEG